MDETRKAEIRLRAEAATVNPRDGNDENHRLYYHAREDILDLLAALDAAEQRVAGGERHTRALLVVEWVHNICPFCNVTAPHGHRAYCPRQAAAKWLEEHSPHEHG